MTSRFLRVLFHPPDLRHLKRGTSTKEFANLLGFSESLIKQELVRIFDKLGAKDRAHAATLAVQRGLVDLLRRWGGLKTPPSLFPTTERGPRPP